MNLLNIDRATFLDDICRYYDSFKNMICLTQIFLVNTHDGIVAHCTDETRLLPIVGPQVLMILHAFGEVHSLSDGASVKVAVEIHPFPAIV